MVPCTLYPRRPPAFSHFPERSVRLPSDRRRPQGVRPTTAPSADTFLTEIPRAGPCIPSRDSPEHLLDHARPSPQCWILMTDTHNPTTIRTRP